MAKKQGVKTNTLVHVWNAYAKELLLKNPTWFGRYQQRGRIKNELLYCIVEGKVKLMYCYKRFRQILEYYFDNAKKAVIQGKSVRINECGIICAKRVERDYRKQKQKKFVDWFKTVPHGFTMVNGKKKWNKVIHQKGDYWSRIGWYKPGIKGESVYEFKPAGCGDTNRGQGFTHEFAKANRDNPLLQYQYLFCPIQLYEKKTQPLEEYADT